MSVIIQNEVIEAAAYDPEADLLNPTGSVFCAHGAGFIVEWDKVHEYMHVEKHFKKEWYQRNRQMQLLISGIFSSLKRNFLQ